VVLLAPAGRARLYTPFPAAGTVIAYGPEIVREVTAQYEVYYKYPLNAGLSPQGEIGAREAPLKHFGVGLFGLNSSAHRTHRRLLIPAFHKQRVDAYRDTMVRIINEELDRWPLGMRHDIAAAMRTITMRVVVNTLFGPEVESLALPIAQQLIDAINMTGSLTLHLFRWDYPGLPYHHFLTHLGRIDAGLRRIIAQKRATSGQSDDMLALLLQARDAETSVTLTDDELLGHIGVIFVAGHETSANALSWTLFLLAQHPTQAADLLDELDAILHGEAPTIEHLAHLPLLDRVVKESLRIISPAPWNWRVTAQPTELGGYALPAGSEVFVSIYATHHMPAVYPQPNAFNPQRWETIAPTPYEYNPFSAGPRMCIGATFAVLEIKLALALLLQRYRLECLPNTILNAGGLLVMIPDPGLWMVVHPQDRHFQRGVGGIQGTIRQVVDLPS